jgi:hypothetical protein
MERFFKKPHMVAESRCGPLASFLDEIAQELHDDGYAMMVACKYAINHTEAPCLAASYASVAQSLSKS